MRKFVSTTGRKVIYSVGREHDNTWVEVRRCIRPLSKAFGETFEWKTDGFVREPNDFGKKVIEIGKLYI